MSHAAQNYRWGSSTAIAEVLRVPPDGRPFAEAWFGAHPTAPGLVSTDAGDLGLDRFIAADPAGVLGEDVVARFGPTLPYLLKLIAADAPLSLQVHPDQQRARAGYAAEDAAGVPLDAPHRNYKDRNHKPELLYALTRFEALAGFRAPRRAAELFAGLDTPLARDLHAALAGDRSAEGIRKVFRYLLEPTTRPGPEAVAELAEACQRRLVAGSPSPRADRTVLRLAEAYPGDPGVATSLLLNPVTLQPGDALFVPAGSVHAYLAGLGVEIMANSDNVLRAGLTHKHVDIDELLANVDYVAAPPIRIAPERFRGATRVYYAPVDDFELSITRLGDTGAHALPGRGPRILLCIEGEIAVATASGATLTLRKGQAAFVSASDGSCTVAGDGTLVQADVP
jgi:mannose-6-phosphate isomerase